MQGPPAIFCPQRLSDWPGNFFQNFHFCLAWVYFPLVAYFLFYLYFSPVQLKSKSSFHPKLRIMFLFGPEIFLTYFWHAKTSIPKIWPVCTKGWPPLVQSVYFYINSFSTLVGGVEFLF
jgi:hypothetical protein